MPRSSRPPQRVRTVGNRMEAFREFKRRTGAWPRFSIAVHVARYVLMLVIISLVLWYGQRHPESPGRSTLVFVVVAPLFMLLWTVVESLVWNYDLRTGELTSRGTFLTVKQFPEG